MKMTRRESLQLFILCLMIITVSIFVIKEFTHEPSTGKNMIYVLGMVSVFFIGFFKKGDIKYKITWTHIAFIGFGISAILSLISVFIDNPQYSPYTVDLSIYILFLSITAIFLSNFLNMRSKIQLVLYILVISGIIVAFDGFLNYFFAWDLFVGDTGSNFIRSTIGNPNFVADYMGLTLPLAIYLIITPSILPEFVKESKIKFIILKSIMLFGILIELSLSLMSGSRTVMVGIFGGIILFLLLYFIFGKKKESKEYKFRKLNKWIIIIAIIISIIMIFVVLNPFTENNKITKGIKADFQDLVTSSGSWENRFSAWVNSIYQLLDEENKLRIPFGTGAGTFQLYHLLYTGKVQSDHPEYAGVWSNFKRTHNDYIQGLGETGIIGFIFIIILMATMMFRYIRNLFRIKNRDDYVLYLALGAAIFSLSLHTMFEFPLHMQPNLMAGIIIISIAMGNYFNTELKERKIKKAIFYIPFTIISVFLVYSKIIAYLGEGFFRQGQIDQTYYIQIEGELAKNDESVIKGRIKDLENLEGDYSYLKDLNSFLAVRESKLRSENPNLPELEFIKYAENARTSEITKIYNELNNVLKQINALDSKASEYYENALNKFIQSVNINPVFGKSLWYLAGMATKQERFEKIKSSDDYAIEVLKGEDHLSSRIVDEFEGNLNIIPLPERDLRDLPFKDFVTENENDLFDSQYANVLNIKYLAQIQCLYDAADYYESSMITFSERQTPRIVAKIYKSIYDELNKYIGYISNYKDQLNDSFEGFEELVGELNSRVVEAAEMVEYWYETAITILPAGRQVNDDWKNIYYEYATVLNSLDYYSLEEMKEKLVHIAEKKAKASFGMNSLLIDVPNELMSYAINFNKELPNDQRIEYVKKIIEVFKPVYTSLKEKYTSEKGNENERTQMKIFIDNYENIASQINFSYSED